MKKQQFAEALSAYQRAVKLDPLDRDSQPLYHAGQILLFRGSYAEAEVHLQKAVSAFYSPLTLHEEEVWNDYAVSLWHTGKPDMAIKNLQNSIVANPTFTKAYNNMACALVTASLARGPDHSMMHAGLWAIEQAIGVLPQMPLYWRNAGVLLNLAGDPEVVEEDQRFRDGGSHAIEVS